MSIYSRFGKRIVDIGIALIALIILSPLFLFIAFAVKIKIGSPIIFKQERPGLNEKIFMLYKFRTMTNAKDKQGNLLSDSDRLTRFGNRLRKSSLDELPELINVLKGDMSIVGPRPLLKRYLPYFYDYERLRSKVRPGITGLSQVNGRNALSWEERFATDIKYVKNISLRTDLSIMLKTIIVVLQKKDVLIGKELHISDLDIERSSKNKNADVDNKANNRLIKDERKTI